MVKKRADKRKLSAYILHLRQGISIVDKNLEEPL